MQLAALLRRRLKHQWKLAILLLTTAVWSGGLVGYGFLFSHLEPTEVSRPQGKTEEPDDTAVRSPIKPQAKLSTAPPQRFTTFNQIRHVPAGKFHYSGSPVWSPIRLGVDSAIRTERREFQVTDLHRPSQNHRATPFELLKSKKIAFVQATHAPEDTIGQGSQASDLQLQQVPVAYDGIAFAVHPSLPISGLTFHQLAKIYCGRVTNWKELGGPDLAIQPISLQGSADAMVKRFEKDVLKFRPFGHNLRVAPTTTTAIHHLAATPGGIFFGSAATIVPQCAIKPLAIGRKSDALVPVYQEPLVPSSRCPKYRNQINISAFQTQQYPLTQQLSVVFGQPPQSGQPVGQAYAQLLLTDQGQTLIKRSGFAPVK
ncbi:substrate-binding domain-containing protein [Acaryochloris sp. IP29b_bin.148]|uniref:substrate-binding domain-containing protein n=1 Tax=Acaryochloris sp. IP29b_bin.148 TaxID=2969218 RepID=UPI00262704A1|nr:substrate-binding domain-containing protein [Acaryochloris sp. IP29b_bin.148]